MLVFVLGVGVKGINRIVKVIVGINILLNKIIWNCFRVVNKFCDRV